MLPLFITLLAIYLIVYVVKFYRNAARYPRGPSPWPVVGNCLEMNPEYTADQFQEMSQIYGPIFTLHLPDPMVAVTSYEDIKEGLVTRGDDFIGRSNAYPDTFYQLEVHKGIAFADSENWHANRRASTQILKDFGMTKAKMEDRINGCIDDLMIYINPKIKNNELIDFRLPINVCISNIICDIVFGYKGTYQDTTRINNYLFNLDEAFTKLSGRFLPSLYRYFNDQEWLISFFNLFKPAGVMGMKEFGNTVRKDVAAVKKTYVKGEEPQNFIHAYLEKMEVLGGHINDEELDAVVSDLWFAGMDTTRSTMLHFFNLMALYPAKQDKARKEILKVIGSDNLITMADKVNLPYCSALIIELQRQANIIPFNISHRAIRDTEINGNKIPKDTIVFFCIYNVMKYDKQFSADSADFKPERFLNEDESAIVKGSTDRVIPFSLGKRQCMGMSLANLELFLICTRFLQKYKISVPEGVTPPKQKAPWSIIMKPEPFSYKTLKRFECRQVTKTTKHLLITADRIFTPDIVLFNNADGMFEASFMCNVIISNKGDILWVPPAIYKSSCIIDVEFFPFDEQICILIFGSWTYNSNEVKLDFLGAQYIDLSEYSPSSIWDIIDAPATLVNQRTRIEFQVRMRRKPLFFTIVLLIPVVLMAFLSVSVYFLPTESTEKITLTISLLLSIVLFLLVVSKILPPTSSTIPLLAKYLLLTFVLNVITILATVIIINVYFRAPSTHRMPSWVRTVFLDTLPIFICMRRPKIISAIKPKKSKTNSSKLPGIGEFNVTKNIHHPLCPVMSKKSLDDDDNWRLPAIHVYESNPITTGKDELTSDFYPLTKNVADAISAIEYITDHIKQDEEYKMYRDDWKYVGMILDRLMLYIFFGITLGGTIGILFSSPTVFEHVNQKAELQKLIALYIQSSEDS
uniref:Cytochrome P450 n=1 Tax=Rhabditophanes sp. KR3021 TaxID=114890 RepID=A0AC35UDF2_9BILA